MFTDFNPRSPHGERRDLVHLVNASLDDFNPRSPHGERRPLRSRFRCPRNFNPRSPHGERRYRRAWRRRVQANFNPRSPHGERQQSCFSGGATSVFQSTLPARGATDFAKAGIAQRYYISIHAPRTGSDIVAVGCTSRRRHFNPRSPHGERHGGGVLLVSLEIFQSTLPARGATSARQRRD